jgi:hypothetical protein
MPRLSLSSQKLVKRSHPHFALPATFEVVDKSRDSSSKMILNSSRMKFHLVKSEHSQIQGGPK